MKTIPWILLILVLVLAGYIIYNVVVMRGA
jgi:hypothetical protein